MHSVLIKSRFVDQGTPECLISLMHSDQLFSCVGRVELGVFLTNESVKFLFHISFCHNTNQLLNLSSYNAPCICFCAMCSLSEFLHQAEVYWTIPWQFEIISNLCSPVFPSGCISGVHLSFLVLQEKAPALLQKVGSLLVSMGQDERTWYNFSLFLPDSHNSHYGWIELLR